MAIEALAGAAVKEIGAEAAREAATKAGLELAQKMASELGAKSGGGNAALKMVSETGAQTTGGDIAQKLAVDAGAKNGGAEFAQRMSLDGGRQNSGSELQTAMMERQTVDEGFRVGEMPEEKGEGRELLKQKEAKAADELRGKFDAEDVRPTTDTAENHTPAKSEMSKTDVSPELSKTGELPGLSEGREIHWPQTGGHWEALPDGNWKWVPDADYSPLKQNEDGKAWKDILNREGIDGIIFTKDGEPDFSEISRESIEIDDFTPDMNDNFAQADVKTAEKWNQEAKSGKTDWKPQDVQSYRTENKLVWHERSDMKTMDLVPKDVHNNIPHSGGRSVARHLQDSTFAVKQTALG